MNRASKTTLGKNDFARIPEDQMQNFRLMVEKAQSEIVIDPSRLRVGATVRIKTGSLEGLECNVYQESDGSTMLALHVDFLGYAKIKCPSDLLSLIKNDDWLMIIDKKLRLESLPDGAHQITLYHVN